MVTGTTDRTWAAYSWGRKMPPVLVETCSSDLEKTCFCEGWRPMCPQGSGKRVRDQVYAHGWAFVLMFGCTTMAAAPWSYVYLSGRVAPHCSDC